jgi:hypothetical protein
MKLQESNMDEKGMTFEELRAKVESLEKYTANLHQLLYDTSYKEEVWRRLQLDSSPTIYDSYIKALPVYQNFIEKVHEIKNTTKISDKLSLIEKFNTPDNKVFTMYVDDTDVFPTIEASGELSLKTYKAILELPHTETLEIKLQKLMEDEPATVDTPE